MTANTKPRRAQGRPAGQSTALMRQVKARVGMDPERYVRDWMDGYSSNEDTLRALANDLDVSMSTLGYWMLRWGIRMEYVAVVPGDQVYAIGADGSERLVLSV